MGFEVITTYVGSMENPSKQIPRAIIAGGIAIAALYLFSSFGIGAAIPAMDVSLDSGIMDAVGIMAGVGSVLFIVVGIVFLITLFGNMVSWSFGVNFVAEHAAKKEHAARRSRTRARRTRCPPAPPSSTAWWRACSCCWRRSWKWPASTASSGSSSP